MPINFRIPLIKYVVISVYIIATIQQENCYVFNYALQNDLIIEFIAIMFNSILIQHLFNY